MKKEKSYSPMSGYIALIVILGMVGFPIYMMIAFEQFWWTIMGGLGLFLCGGGRPGPVEPLRVFWRRR